MPPVARPVPMPVVLRPFVIHVLLVNTMTQPVKRLNLLLAKNAVQVNTMNKPVKAVAKTIAMLGRILFWTKVPVQIVFKANTKTKMAHRIAKAIAMLDRTLTPTKVTV